MTAPISQVKAATRRKPKVASVKDVREAVENITEEHLRCRDLGHVWIQYKVKKVRAGYERSCYCRSCKASKHQFVSVKGEILATSYAYSTGYQFKGIGRVQSEGKSVLRLESLTRTLVNSGGDLDVDVTEIDLTDSA